MLELLIIRKEENRTETVADLEISYDENGIFVQRILDFSEKEFPFLLFIPAEDSYSEDENLKQNNLGYIAMTMWLEDRAEVFLKEEKAARMESALFSGEGMTKTEKFAISLLAHFDIGDGLFVYPRKMTTVSDIIKGRELVFLSKEAEDEIR